MNDLSNINAACSTTIENIQNLLNNIKTIALLVRDARADMLDLTSELAGLSLSIAMLQDDCEHLSYPDNVLPDLSTNFQHVLEKCDEASKEMSTLIQNSKSSSFSSNYRWTIDAREDVKKLRTSFEGCKRAIVFALMVGQMVVMKTNERRIVESDNHTTKAQHGTFTLAEVQDDLPAVSESIVQDPVKPELQVASDITLQRCLDELTTLAERVTDTDKPESMNLEHFKDSVQDQYDEEFSAQELPPSTPLESSPTHSRLSSQLSQSNEERNVHGTDVGQNGFLSPISNLHFANITDPRILLEESTTPKTEANFGMATSELEPDGERAESVEQQYIAPSAKKETFLDMPRDTTELTRIPQIARDSVESDPTLLRELSRGPQSRRLLSQSSTNSQEDTLLHVQEVIDSTRSIKSSVSVVYQKDIAPAKRSTPLSPKEELIEQLNEMLIKEIQAPQFDRLDARQTQITKIENLLENGAGPGLPPVSTRFGSLSGLDAALMLEIRGAVRFAIVNLLLSQGAKANANHAILQEAIHTWSIPVIRLLMVKGAQLPPPYDSNVQASFFIAQVSQSCSDIVRFLLTAGADPNSLLGSGRPSFFHFIPSRITGSEHPSNRPDLASLYVKLTGVRQTILSRASMVNQQDVVEVLLNHGVAASSVALRAASLCGHLSVVRTLLDHADTKGEHIMKSLAIYCAAATGQTHVVKFLVDCGGDINGLSDTEETNLVVPVRSPLLLAISMGQAIAARILVSHGAKIAPNSFVVALQHALHVQDKTISKGLVRLILRNGEPDLEVINDALCIAAVSGNVALTEILLGIGKADAKNSEGQVLCALAARSNQLEVLKVILSHKPQKSTTALRLAAKRGHAEIIKILLDYGIDVDGRDKNKETSLHLACMANQLEAVEVLLQRGARVDLKNEQGTPLCVTQIQLQDFLKNSVPIGEVRRCEVIIELLKKAEVKLKKKGFWR